MATINLGRVGFVNKGAHNIATAYKVNDVVTYNSGTYACIQAHTGQLPTATAYWQNWVSNDKALDSAVVHKTGNETIAGTKTFSSSPIVPTPTTETQATNKKYVDDSISSISVGKVLQVIQTVKTDLFSTSSTSFVDITGLSASITPKSTSSKILVDVAINSNITDAGWRADFRLVRDSTPIGLGTAGTNRIKATFVQDSYNSGSLSGRASSAKYLDSPSTTSATTYKLQCSTTGGTLMINYTGNGEDNTSQASTICTITLTEIGV